MKKVWFASVVMLVTAMSQAEVVLLNETFDGASLNAGTWNVIARTGNSVGLTGSGEMQITLATTDTYEYQGIVSKQAFAVPAGQTLVVDYSGTNSSAWSPGYDSQGSSPSWIVSAANLNGSSFIYQNLSWSGMDRSAIIMGANMWSGDSPSGGSGNSTYGSYKHTIITIDLAHINYYISDLAYSTALTPVATVATGTLFSSSDLASGVYVIFWPSVNKVGWVPPITRYLMAFECRGFPNRQQSRYWDWVFWVLFGKEALRVKEEFALAGFIACRCFRKK